MWNSSFKVQSECYICLSAINMCFLLPLMCTKKTLKACVRCACPKWWHPALHKSTVCQFMHSQGRNVSYPCVMLITAQSGRRGIRVPFSSLAPLWYSVCPFECGILWDSILWKIGIMAKLCVNKSARCSYTQILSSLTAAASGLTCRVQLRKYFVSCQHHWNIFTRCETCSEFFWLCPTVRCPHATTFYG